MTEDRLRYLGSSETITDKLDQIIQAFVTFYGEERKSEIEQKLKNVLILRFNTTYALAMNIRKVKESILREVYGLGEDEGSLINVPYLIKFLQKEDITTYDLLNMQMKELVFGDANLSADEALKKYKIGEYPKLNEFLDRYNEILPVLKPYEKLIDREDAKRGEIREKYYKVLVDEFSDLIPKEELDFYHLIGFPDKVMKSYFDWSIDGNGHCFDNKSEVLLNDESTSRIKKDSVIRDRMAFLRDNGYDFMTYEEALNDPKCLSFIEKSKIVCEKIAQRKSELFKKQTIEMIESLEDYQALRKEIDSHNYLDKDDPLGPFVYESFGISCYQANYTFDGEHFILSPIVLINSGTTEPDCTIIHELNHAFEYHTIDVNYEGCTNMCGWEYHSMKFKQQQDNSKLKYQGISRENELLNEYINDRIAQEITDIMHGQGNYIFRKTRGDNTSNYMAMDFLLDAFYREFREYIIPSRSNGNIGYLYEKIGKDNFTALNSLVNEIYKKFGLEYGLNLALEDYEENRQTDNAKIIRDYLLRRDVIINKMKNNLEISKTSDGSVDKKYSK